MKGLFRYFHRLGEINDSEKGFSTTESPLNTGEEAPSFSKVIAKVSSPVYCPYYKITCPDNIPHYSMKCLEGFNANCSIKKFYDRYGKNADELNVGSKI